MSAGARAPGGPLGAAEVAAFGADGFLVQPALFAPDEVALALAAARADPDLAARAFGRADGEGGEVRLALWNHPGDGVLGRVARSARVVDRVEQLLGGEVYHYHSKLIRKDARIGGAWTWHQDYGYWYENGVLFPELASAFVALDPATRENGCLQVARGSHRLGRIDHRLSGDQAGADPERVAAALERLEVVPVELAPGDALFFHCNLLHRSDRNRSGEPRWALICCYNRATNDPYRDSHHPRYTPLAKVGDDAIRAAGNAPVASGGADVGWLDPGDDHSARKDG